MGEDGACKMPATACEWNDGTDEELTDESGNIVSDGGAPDGETATYYAWIGSEDEEEFDIDDTDHVSVTVDRPWTSRRGGPEGHYFDQRPTLTDSRRTLTRAEASLSLSNS